MKGKFKPRNPSKYKGDSTNIIFRSSWEFKVMMYLDSNTNVNWWQSEELAIRYKSPVDKKIHRYFVDFICNAKTIDGKNKTSLIEVKPKYQTIYPKKTEKMTNRRFIKESIDYEINKAKWAAAEIYCHERNYEFVIMTEDDIFANFSL